MADGDGWISQLIAGLAQYLHNASVGVWRPTGSYTSGETAICDRNIPASPDRLITISTYPVTDSPYLQDSTIGVQARIRGTTDVRVCDDIGDAIFEAIHGLKHVVLGDIRIVRIYRQSYGSLGIDGNKRWESSHNYFVEAMRPTAAKTE